jgi:LuxR family maltose regulon positive regulatory protein
MPLAESSDLLVRRAAGPSAAGIVSRPWLLEQLGSARVTMVSAPPGTGKTVLLRSWLCETDLADRAGWVTVNRDERNPQQFWLSVLDALRQTVPGSSLVGRLTAAPDLDGWAIVERLLTDLAPLEERLWLVIDDLHELPSDQARQQLELLVMRAPEQLRFVLATRHDVQLGLHRLRLEGELAEIRADDLRFSLGEAGELLLAAGVELSDQALAVLVDRTEGWAAGLRLAALSLAGHPDPERFAKEFSGTERTVSEYLLAEVLDRQPEDVRRLLLRTSVLERVNGELADVLTGGSGGERILHDLERAGAFVVSVDAERSWFRYHQLFAGLLRLQLRHTEPDEMVRLHGLAAGWLTAHGFGVEAIGHAQAARDWGLAARLLADHWPGLYLDGQAVTVHALLAGFPAEARAADAELAALAAADELARGSLEAAERYLRLAAEASASVPEDRRGQALVLIGVIRLLVARQRGNPSAVAEEAQRLQALTEASDAAWPGLGEELRALALVSLGVAEVWAVQFDRAEPHLEQGVALARRIERPFLEFTGLVYGGLGEWYRSFPRTEELGLRAVEMALRHGWGDESAAGIAYMMLGSVTVWQGRPEEAELWIQRADRTVRAEAEPAAALGVHHIHGLLELAQDRPAEALATYQAAERLARLVAGPHLFAAAARTFLVTTLVRLGDIDRAAQALAELGESYPGRGEVCVATAVLRLAQHDPRAAIAALEPVLDGSTRIGWRAWLVEASLLEAIARDALGDPAAAGRALERALDVAELDGAILWFLLSPAPVLLERHARQHTAHAGLLARILDLLSGRAPAPPSAGPRSPLEPLSDSEIRVLRYLPTHLSAPEIARELSVSTSTVKTHLRNLYGKFGVHSRAEAVERARAVALLAPSAHQR